MINNIIDNLTILYNYELLNNNKYKALAYNKVIQNLKNSNIKTINNINDLKDIKGIGHGINGKINEIINTGKLKIIDDIIKDPKYILGTKILKIYGVGTTNIHNILNKINNFDDLKLEKNKNLLNDKQKIGLKYYDDLLLKIPCEETMEHLKFFKLLHDLHRVKFDFVGSFRRKNKYIGDIDILIKNNDKINFNFKSLIDKLKSSGYILDILAFGKNKFMGICKISHDLPARRIDILLTDEKHYPFSLLYFTGSYKFNIYIRNIALSKGYSLNEYGFTYKNKSKINNDDIQIKTEKDIFKFLDIKYIEPSKRI